MRPMVDSQFCWIQAFASFLFLAVLFGVSFSFGILYVELLEEFPASESQGAWISSLNFGFLMMFSPLSMRILKRVPVQIVCCIGSLTSGSGLFLSSKATNIGMLFLTFSFMHGVGTNLCYMSAIWILRRNFTKKRDFAFGIAHAGSGAGGIMIGALLPGLVWSNGWRGSMQILSYMAFALVALSFTMIPGEEEMKVDEENVKKNFIFGKSVQGSQIKKGPSPLRNGAFIVLALAIVNGIFVSLIPYCHIVNYAIQQGVSRKNADILPLFIAIGSFIGRLGLGKLVGLYGLTRITLGQLIFLLQCLVTTFVTLAKSIDSLVAFCLLFGLFDGAFCCLTVIIAYDVFKDSLEALNAMSHLFWILAFPYTLGAPFSAWLYKQTGSYEIPFFICGAILFIATVLMSLVRYLVQSQDMKYVITFSEGDISQNNHYRPNVILQSTNHQLTNSRSCSLVDLALAAYNEHHNSSSKFVQTPEYTALHSRACLKDHCPRKKIPVITADQTSTSEGCRHALPEFYKSLKESII